MAEGEGPIKVTQRLVIKNSIQESNTDFLLCFNPTNKQVGHIPLSLIIQNPDERDVVLKTGTIAISGTSIIIQANQFAWRLNRINYLTTPYYTTPIAAATDNFYRADIVVGNTSSNYQLVQGTENDTQAIEPSVPDGTIKLATIYVFGDVITGVTPVDGEYVLRSESQNLPINSGGVTTLDQITLIDHRSFVTLTGSVTTVKSAQANALYIRPGKPHFLKNDSGHDFTVNHLDGTGTGNIKYSTSDGLDLIIKNGQIVEFITNANDLSDVRFELVGSVVDLSNYYTKDEVDDLDAAVLSAANAYADGLAVGLLRDRGNWDASSNLFPTTGGSGTSGAIRRGDLWYVSVAGVLKGLPVTTGDSFRALADAPGQTAGNWAVMETNIGYVPENVANKTGIIIGNEASTTLYLHIAGMIAYFQQKLTSTIFGDFINALTNKSTLVDADYSVVSDSEDGFKAKKVSWLNIFNFIKSKTEVVYSCAVSDETSDLIAATLITFRMPHEMTLTRVKLSLNTAPSGSKVIVDIKKNGTTIFSTLISVDVSSTTSVGAAVAYVISDPNLVDDSIITILTTTVGSTSAGKGLKVTLIGKRN